MSRFNLRLIENRLVEGVEVAVEKDPSLNYEVGNFFSRLLSFFAASFLNLIPSKLGGSLIYKSSRRAKAVMERATTYYALDTLYTTHKLSFEDGFLQGFIDYFWFKLGNPKAVRNRLRLVKKILKEIILSRTRIQPKGRKCIFSLGCGSARAIIETLHDIKDFNLSPGTLDIKLLDKAQEALNSSKVLIAAYQLKKYHFSFFLDKIRNFNRYLEGTYPDVIEMVGVVDYLEDEKAIEIFKKIYDTLTDRGFFITANIRRNRETLFISRTVKWHMVYREPEELIKILLTAGFEKDKIKIVLEPLKIHMVALCEK